MSNIALRSVSALTVLGLSFGAAAVGAPIAFATPATVQIPSSTIDFGKKGSLSISKRAVDKGVSGEAATGNETQVDASTLRNIPFELQLIQKIETAADWEAAVEAGKAGADAVSGTVVAEGSTNEAGQLNFSGLDLGLYKLVELEDNNDATITAPASLVYIPMTNPAGNNTWNYDVKVYPKNQFDPADTEIIKEVDDARKNIGDSVTYTLTSGIPDITVSNVTWYQVTDQLDNEILDSDNANVSVQIAGQDAVAGADYALFNQNGEIKVSFTAAGLTKLTEAKKANHEAKVTTTIAAKVTKVADGIAPNKAYLIHNDPKVNSEVEIDPNDPHNPPTVTPPEDPKESNEVKSYWANIQLNKVGEENKPLAGAKFELFRCSVDGVLDGGALAVDHDNDPATPLVTTLTTDSEGKATFHGLKVTDFENNLPADPSAYCLVETEAPAGYSLLPKPEVVTLNLAETHGAQNPTITKVANVTNLPETRGSLPLTGGMGIGFLVALGALIVAVGAYTAKRFGKTA